jgi:hypothetical protein
MHMEPMFAYRLLIIAMNVGQGMFFVEYFH